MNNATCITRRCAVAALGASAFALAAAGTVRATESAQVEAAPAQLTAENAITAPEAPGTLPLFCEDPREVDLGDKLVIATPFYAVTLPKSLLGDGFAWEYSEEPVVVPGDMDFDGDGTVDNNVVTAAFLTVTPAADVPAFTVYTQTGVGSIPVAGTDCIWEVGYNRAGARIVYVRTDLYGEPWVKFVSAGAYAYDRREADGTRVITPDYSVMVPDGWIGEGWCYTYNDGTSRGGDEVNGKRLDIYASPADRDAGDPAMTYECWDQYMEQNVANDPWAEPGTVGGRHYIAAGTLEVGPAPLLRALSWRYTDQDKADAAAAVQLWAKQASTEVCQRAMQQAPVQTSAELWHVVTPWYSFDIPEPWRGRVEVAFENAGNAVVWPNGVPGAWLVRTQLSPAASEHHAGDVGAAALFQLENGRGEFVTLRGFNLPFVLQGGGWREGYVSGLEPTSPQVEQEAIDLATGGAFTAEQVLDGADAVGAAFAYYQQAVIPTIEVAMDGDWAKLASFWLTLDEKYLFMPVSEFYARAVEALGDDPTWINDLAVREDVQEWAIYYGPVSHFLTTTLVRVINYPEAATSDLTVMDFAAQFAPQPR